MLNCAILAGPSTKSKNNSLEVPFVGPHYIYLQSY